jgi:hypothetical protein
MLPVLIAIATGIVVASGRAPEPESHRWMGSSRACVPCCV